MMNEMSSIVEGKPILQNAKITIADQKSISNEDKFSKVRRINGRLQEKWSRNKTLDFKEVLQSEQFSALSTGAKARVEALAHAEQIGYEAASLESGFSKGTLFRWAKKLKDAEGNLEVLVFDSDNTLSENATASEIVDRFIPVSEYVSKVSNSENNKPYIVIDIEKLKTSADKAFYSGDNTVRKSVIAEGLLERHKDDDVLSLEQVKREDYSPLPLFYYPGSVEAATTNTGIARAKFHMTLWDLQRRNGFDNRDNEYPTRDGGSLSGLEAMAAVRIFHPKYGDARRDRKTDKLMVKNPNFDANDPDSPEIVLFNADLLRDLSLYQPLAKDSNQAWRGLHVGIKEELPHLLANKELMLEDIREQTRDRKGNFDVDFKPKTVKGAYLMLNGINHYIGDRFIGCEVQPFTKTKALIFKKIGNREVLVGMFTINEKFSVKNISTNSAGQEIPRTNAAESAIKEINYVSKLPTSPSGLEQGIAPQRQIELETEVTQAVTLLIETAQEAERLVRSELNNVDPETLALAIDKVQTDLLAQAVQTIEMASRTKDAKSLKENLEASAYDSRGYVSILQAVGAERMTSNPLERMSAAELSETDRTRMRKLVRDSYKNETPEFQALVANSLEDHINDPDTDFYLLRNQNGLIISYNRFDKQYESKNGELARQYFGSFIADRIYFGVGSIMMERTIKDQLEKCPTLYAHCDPRAKISQKYIEDGFIGTQTVSPAGKFSFEIWRSKESSNILTTKQMSQTALIELANQTMSPETDYFVREVEEDDQFLELDAAFPYLLTRYFTVAGKTYAAFEINTTLSHQFVLPEAKDTQGAAEKLAA